MTSEVQTEHIIQIVKNIATLTEKIMTLQDSVDIVNSKIDTLSKIEADVLLLKKDLVSTENKANKCHARVDDITKRVEALEDKGAKRMMKVSEKIMLYILGALGMYIIAKSRDIIALLWGK